MVQVLILVSILIKIEGTHPKLFRLSVRFLQVRFRAPAAAAAFCDWCPEVVARLLREDKILHPRKGNRLVAAASTIRVYGWFKNDEACNRVEISIFGFGELFTES